LLTALETGSEADAVERVPARLDAHLGAEQLGSAVRQRGRVHERLADRLDREQRRHVADHIGDAVHRHEAYAEVAGRCFGELGDVGSHRAVVETGKIGVEISEIRLQWGRHGDLSCKPRARTVRPTRPRLHT